MSQLQTEPNVLTRDTNEVNARLRRVYRRGHSGVDIYQTEKPTKVEYSAKVYIFASVQHYTGERDKISSLWTLREQIRLQTGV